MNKRIFDKQRVDRMNCPKCKKPMDLIKEDTGKTPRNVEFFLSIWFCNRCKKSYSKYKETGSNIIYNWKNKPHTICRSPTPYDDRKATYLKHLKDGNIKEMKEMEQTHPRLKTFRLNQYLFNR